MYRKIIFIVFLIVQLHLMIKIVILLALSFLSLMMILIHKPFVLKELNILELKSNFAALTILFVGYLYLCGISDNFKAFCFAAIVLINTWFFWNFLFDIIFLLFQIYYEKFKKLSPRLTNVFAKVLIEMEEFSIQKYLKRKQLEMLSQKLYKANYSGKITKNLNF